jgi:general secretion pathway protein I
MIKNGFTLIEVLIALAIISIAMLAIIKTSTENIRGAAYLQDKMAAVWVGQQVLNEVRAGLYNQSLNEADKIKRTTTLLGKKWPWQLQEESTPNPRIQKVSINVFAPGQEADEDENSSLIYLESYVYIPSS